MISVSCRKEVKNVYSVFNTLQWLPYYYLALCTGLSALNLDRVLRHSLKCCTKLLFVGIRGKLVNSYSVLFKNARSLSLPDILKKSTNATKEGVTFLLDLVNKAASGYHFSIHVLTRVLLTALHGQSTRSCIDWYKVKTKNNLVLYVSFAFVKDDTCIYEYISQFRQAESKEIKRSWY